MRRLALIACAAASAAPAPAWAVPSPPAQILAVSGTGTWGSQAPVTAESAPGESWSFSFDLPQNYGANPTSATNFHYSLNGTQVSVGLTSVEFFDATEDGMFALLLSDGDLVALYGQDVGSTGSLVPGLYDVASDLEFSNPPAGTGSGTVAIASVPEPVSASVLATGLLGLGLARRWLRRRSDAMAS